MLHRRSAVEGRRNSATVLLLWGALLLAGAAQAWGACQIVTVARISSDPDPPSATAQIHYTAAPSAGANLSHEGLAERVSDLLIYDAGGATPCFSAGNVFTVTYTLPVSSGPDIDVFDSAGALALQTTRTGSTVRISVSQPGTSGNLVSSASGAALRIKNVRVDATGLTPMLNALATVSASVAGTLGATARNVGTSYSTIASGAAVVTVGAGAQNSDLTLATHARFSFTENFADAFRVANASGVAGDSSAATSLLLDAGNTVPWGVTVTFPPQIVSGGLTFTLRPGTGGGCSGPVQCFAIYDTAQNAAGAGTVTVSTGAWARTGADGFTPAIGVHVGSSSAAGTATLRALFGPAAAGNGNDDIDAAAVPRYAGASRAIFSGNWFTIAPAAPVIALTPALIDFGRVDVGTRATDEVVLMNTTPVALQIAQMTIRGTIAAQVWIPCAATVAPLTSCTVRLMFAPETGGPQSGELVIDSNAAGSPHRIPLSGTGVVLNPLPVLTSLSPSKVAAGAASLLVTIDGSGFTHDSQALWNGAGRQTSFISDTRLTAILWANDLSVAGSGLLTVFSPLPGGGTSNGLRFLVSPGAIPASPHLYYIPHVVSGAGFATKFTIVDLSRAQNSVTVNFVAQDGALLESDTYTLAAGGTLRVAAPESARRSPASTRWAIIGTDGAAAVHALFDFVADGERKITNSVGFSDVAPMTEFTIPAEFEPRPAGMDAGRTVGLAIANPGGLGSQVTLTLFDQAGAIQAEHLLWVPPFGQVALDLQHSDAFGEKLPAQNFVGAIAVTATAPVCAIALADNYGPFSAIPVTPGRAK